MCGEKVNPRQSPNETIELERRLQRGWTEFNSHDLAGKLSVQVAGRPAGPAPNIDYAGVGLDTGALRNSPPFLLSSLMFPYTDGMQFFLAFLKERSWEEAGVLFRDTPASTEEILHPEKYLQGRDLPQLVEAEAMEAALPAGWQVFFRERLGEFTTREMLGV